MIDQTQRLISTVGDAITQINALNTAIKALPDNKNIEVTVSGEAIATINKIKADLSSLDGKTINVNVVYKTWGSAPAAVTEDITQVIKQVTVPSSEGNGSSDVPVNVSDIEQAADAVRVFSDESLLAAVDARALEEGINRLTASYQAMNTASDGARESLIKLAQEIVAGNVSNKPGAPMNPVEVANGPAVDITDSADAVNEMKNALTGLNGVTRMSVSDMQALEAEIANTDDHFRILGNGINIEAHNNNVLRGTVSDLHDAFNVLYPDIQATSNSVKDLTLPVGMIAGFFQQWGTVIHWVVSGSAELLAVGIPALIALGAAMLIAAQAAANIQARLTSMYTVAEALGPATGQTIGSMLGLGNAIQKAQQAMQPQLYEIYGAAIDAVKGHLGGLAQIGSEVIGIFATFAAKVDVELQGALGAQLTGLISKAVPDLVEFGQVFGNLGHAILNFASAMPGLAEVLLKLLDAFSYLVKLISEIPQPILTAALALEEFFRWGAAINGMIAFMIGSFGKLIGSEGVIGLSLAMKGLKRDMDEVTGEMVIMDDSANAGVTSFSGFARTLIQLAADNPIVTLGIIVATVFAGFVVWVMRANSATDQWISSMQKSINSAPNYSQMNLTLQALAVTTGQETSAQGKLNQSQSAWQQLASGSLENYTALKQASQTFNQELVTENTNVIYLSKALGVSAPTAMAIMQGAGVKLTDTITGNSNAAEVNRQKIDNMLTAYQTLGQQGNQLSADINAVSIASSNQLSNVNKLNQAWQTFVGLSTGVQTDFIAFTQGLSTIAKDAGVAGASFNGLNSQSLTLRNDFEGNISTMTKSLSDLNTALSFGAIGWGQYQTAVATEVKEMLSAGNLSAAQVQQLELIASAAGYTGNSYSSLKGWVDKYGGSQSALNGIINKATAGLANQNSMMSQLQGTLQTDVIQATDQAVLAQGGYTEQLNKTIAAAKDAGTSSSDYKNNLKELDDILKSSGASQQTINAINESLAKTYGTVGNATDNAAGKTKDLNNAFGTQKIAADGLRDEIKNVFIAIGHYVEDYTDVAREAIINGWNAIVSATKNAWDEVKNAVLTAWNAVVGFVESVGNSFSTWWKQHGQELEQVWNAVWGAIKEAVQIVWPVIVSLAQTMWNTILSIFHDAWNIIVPLVKAGWSDIQTTFEIVGAAVKAIWDTLWSLIETILKTAWDAVVAILKVGWDLVVGMFNVFLDLITGHWSQAWNDIKTAGEQIWNAISGFFDQAFHNYADFFESTWNNIKNFFSSTWDDIYTNTKNIWNDIMGFFRGIWSDVTTGFDNTVSSIKRVWNTLQSIFHGPVSFLVNTVYDGGIARLWNDVMGAIGGPKLPTFHFAGGAKIPGYGGGDIVPAMLEPGEAVVPKHLVSAVAPFLGQHGVPGFAKGGYVSPFLGHPIPERIDQGVDFAGALDIVAIGDARIVETNGGGWPGGPFMSYQLTDGPDAGRYIYIAENIIPEIAAGTTVKAGQVIAKMFNGGTGIETGWAAPGGLFPLSQTPGAGGISGANLPPDSATAVGHDFDAFLTSLGVDPAPNFNSPPSGKLPPGMGASQPGGVNPIGGGVFGAIINGVWHAITGTIAGLGDAASAIAAIATGNTTALVNDMLKLVGNGTAGGASADLAKMMVGLPETAVKDAMKWFVNKVKSLTGFSQPTGGTPGTGPPGGANGTMMQNGTQIYEYLLKNLFGGNKIAAAGATASIWGESTWNPFSVGGGGNGLIGWSFPPLNSAELAGGMRTQLPLILQFVTSSGDSGVIAEMFRATSVLQAANEWGRGVERFGINDVHSEGVALATQIMQTHDAGGWIYPGINVIQNKTGGIERTVGPNEGSNNAGVVHTVVNIDGKAVLDALSPAMYQKGSRNNGNANANRYFAPGNGR